MHRYGNGLCQSLYNSQEVGQRAADSIAATFSSPFLGDSALPQLTCGRLATTALPGGGTFAYACAAGLDQPSHTDSQVCCNFLLCACDYPPVQNDIGCNAQVLNYAMMTTAVPLAADVL